MKVNLRLLFLALFAITLTSATAFSQTATIATDQPDYAPGSTAIITGTGFQPGDTVTLQVLHDPTGGDDATDPSHQPWTVIADADGNVSSTWYVPSDADELGATLKLTAVGQSSGLQASWIFTDAIHLNSLSPTSGTTNGGTSVTISGTGFTANTTYSATFGGAASPSVTRNSNTQLTAVTPPHAAGLVNVIVTATPNNGQPSSDNLDNSYTYICPTITVTAIITQAKCHGDPASVTVNATGGTNPYIGTGTFLLADGSTNKTYTVTDNNGCSGVSNSVTATSPSQVLVALTSQTNVLCFGASTGAINITASGGTGSYTYAWTGTGVNATAEDQSGLAAGSYSVIVTDANGCSTASLPVTITQPTSAVAVALTSQTNVLCFGASTGAINITASGGTGPYTYAWTGTGVNATAEDQTGLAAGNYSVIVTDHNGCSTASLPVTITQPTSAVAVALTSQTNVLCFGASTGAINITASGGTGPYTYAWTGTGVNATAEDQTGLAAGNYSVIVTDHNGCSTASLPVTITQPTTAVAVALTSQTNVLCFGASTGAINITASGGTGSYTYAWTGTGVNATAEDQTGLAAGSYSVIVTDANGCSTASLPVTITQPATAVSVVLTSQTNVLCFGASTGAINITASGGTGSYTYAWTGTGVNATAEDQSGLAAGSYSVIVTDANGCSTASLPVTITQPTSAVAVALTSQTNVLCFGASTGAINITASGGTGSYTYAWTGTGVNATAEDQTGLAAGSYSVIVTDANGCSTASLPVTITQPTTAVSVALTSQTNVLCFGASTGAINITASGGTGSYTYAWTGTGVNATAEDQSGLAAGSYSVIVTDANGCSTASLPVTITQPATAVSVVLTSQTNVLCFGASTGAINITASGGTGSYTYAWTGTGVNATAEDQSGLAAGSYSVIVTDANGCSTASLPVTITQPTTAVSVALTSQTNVLCFGASTGAINITASGGTGSYTYAWTGTGVNATAEDQSGLAAGSYSVIVTDANGCSTASLPVTITQPASAVAVALNSQTNVLCFSSSTGAIDITASGGTGPYSYAWTGTGVNATAEDQTGLAAGNYSVIVTDHNGCSTASLPVTITQPTSLKDSVYNDNTTLYYGYTLDQTANITVKPTGGKAPYTVQIYMNRPLGCNRITSSGDEVWTPGAHTLNSSNITCPTSGSATSNPVSTSTNNIPDSTTLNAFGYTVTLTLDTTTVIYAKITDANGCIKYDSTKIRAIDVRCFAGNSGIAKITMCHLTGSTKNPTVQICVDQNAVQAQLALGDYLGACGAVFVTSPSERVISQLSATKLEAKVLPNPTSYYFNMVLRSASNDKVKITVVDILGRTVESRSNVPANSSLQLGNNYRPGVYFVQIMQGKENVMLKLIKEGK